MAYHTSVQESGAIPGRSRTVLFIIMGAVGMFAMFAMLVMLVMWAMWAMRDLLAIIALLAILALRSMRVGGWPPMRMVRMDELIPLRGIHAGGSLPIRTCSVISLIRRMMGSRYRLVVVLVRTILERGFGAHVDNIFLSI